MTNPTRPVFLAAALAVVFAFTIGGPLHTFEEFSEGDTGLESVASAVDELPDEQLPATSRGLAPAQGGAPADSAAVSVAASTGERKAPESAVAPSDDAGPSGVDVAALPPDEAVGGPSEAEAAAVGGPARPTVTYYTVRRGETISDIAKKFEISPMTIMAANDLVNANMIQAGQELRILSTDGAIHEVRSGESLWEIAQKYRAGVDEIAMINGISNPNRIRPAQELVIPGVDAAEIGSMLRSERLVSADGRLLPMFDWPVRGRVSSNFGMRWGRMHYGMDIAVNTGTPVRASARGRVTFSGMNGGYGYLVIIDHGDGVETRYADNSRLVAKVGEYVNRGQIIAYSGNTGNSTGPHLHFEIRHKGNAVDPRNYLR